MANIFEMIERIESLNIVKENKRMIAAEGLQKEICAFVAHYGQVSTDRCPSTWLLYALRCNGRIHIRKDDEDEGGEVEIKNLSLAEIKFIKEFMVETLNRDSKYIEDEIDRYIDLY